MADHDFLQNAFIYFRTVMVKIRETEDILEVDPVGPLYTG